MTDNKQIRRDILKNLYEAHESDSPMVELVHLARELQLSFTALRPSLDFLERKGYIELTKVRFETQEFSCACITDKGIDWFESDESAPQPSTLVANIQKGEATPGTSTLYHQQLAQLRQNLVEHFSVEELRTLAFDLGVEYDGLPGEGKDAKVRELLSFLERCGRIPELVDACSRQRPTISWEHTLETTAKTPLPPGDPPAS